MRQPADCSPRTLSHVRRYRRDLARSEIAAHVGLRCERTRVGKPRHPDASRWQQTRHLPAETSAPKSLIGPQAWARIRPTLTLLTFVRARRRGHPNHRSSDRSGRPIPPGTELGTVNHAVVGILEHVFAPVRTARINPQDFRLPGRGIAERAVVDTIVPGF